MKRSVAINNILGNIKMNVLNLREFISRLLGLKKKVLVGKILKDEDISQLDKEIEYERGYKEGQISALEEEVKELKSVVTPKNLNVAEYLQKQRKSMYYKQFQNSLSMKRMFGMALGKKPIKVLSFNSKKDFGVFNDILIRPDGRFAIVVDNGKKKEPVMVGKDVKHLFTNYGGLSNTIGLGYVNINLDEEGRFAENVLETEVPEIVIDANGSLNIGQVNKDGFMKQLIDKEEHINELYNLLSMYEKEIQKLTSNKHLMKVVARYNQGRATTAETEFAKAFSDVMEIHKNFKDVTKDLTIKGYEQHMAQQKINKLEDMQEAIIEKMSQYLGKPETDIAREQYMNMADDVLSIAQGSKINIIQSPPQQPQKDDGTLTKKFKDMNIGEKQ